MSQVLTAFVVKHSVPGRAKLEDAVRALGFACTVDEFYQPFDCSGFLPCSLDEQPTGFEIDFESSEGILERLPHLRSSVGDRDSAISFRWSSDSMECACVLIFAAALARECDAVVYYHDGDVFYKAERLIAEGRKMMADTR